MAELEVVYDNGLTKMVVDNQDPASGRMVRTTIEMDAEATAQVIAQLTASLAAQAKYAMTELQKWVNTG